MAPAIAGASLLSSLLRDHVAGHGLEGVVRRNGGGIPLGSRQDLEHGMAVASTLECGTSWVNQHGVLDPTVPFGGCKLSGIGCENGVEGLREFLRLHVVNAVPASTDS